MRTQHRKRVRDQALNYGREWLVSSEPRPWRPQRTRAYVLTPEGLQLVASFHFENAAPMSSSNGSGGVSNVGITTEARQLSSMPIYAAGASSGSADQSCASPQSQWQSHGAQATHLQDTPRALTVHVGNKAGSAVAVQTARSVVCVAEAAPPGTVRRLSAEGHSHKTTHKIA